MKNKPKKQRYFQPIKDSFWHLINHFVPHRKNNYQPYAIKHRVLLGYSVILILLKVVVLLGPVALPSSSLYSSAITAKNIVNLTNQARENLGLSPLSVNNKLAEAARKKAEDMLSKSYFAHTSPEGRTPWDWIRGAGYNYKNAGENLAVHFYEAEDVQSGWMASPTHRANIVSPKYDEIGVGTAMGEFEGVTATFVVQMFGRPATVLAQGPAVVQPSAPASIVPEANIKVSQGDSEYKIAVSSAEAKTVSAQLAGEEISLERAPDSNEWSGTIAYNNSVISSNGEPIYLTAVKENGFSETKQVALVAPRSNIQRFYIFNEGADRFTTFFGFLNIGNLNDKVRLFYLGFSIFLGAAILAYLFVLKLRIKNHSVVSHTIAVITLAVFLLVI